jgi:peptide-methionine (S)-S-oxide reductase
MGGSYEASLNRTPKKEKAMGDNTETAVLAGGCAWIMQHLLRRPTGVISTRTGWSGGDGDNPTEESPEGHAEAVEVVFDPGRISYRELLEYFFQVHRPDLDETLVGSIYRSEIFYTSEEQRQVAEETIRDVDASKHWPGKTVTKVSEAGRFLEMEAADQDYFVDYPGYPEGCRLPFPRHRGEAANREATAQLG